MPITDEDKQRRQRFAAWFAAAMRAANYVRPNDELDVPALSRMSGVADNILRRWLDGVGDPSLPNLRRVAPALGLELRDLVVASEQMTAREVGLEEAPEAPTMPPTPEDRIMADDILSDEAKAAVIQMLRALRETSISPIEPRKRKRA